MSVHIPLETGEGARIAHAGPHVVGQQRPDHLVGPGPALALPLRRQQDGTAVEIEPPGGTRTEACRRQHGGQRGGRIVRVVAVPERVPLPVSDDRAQRVILQQQRSARFDPRHPLGQGAALIRGVHEAEAVEDQVRWPVIGRHQPAAGQHAQPRAAVRAPVLGDPSVLRQVARRGHPFHRVGGLRDERGGLGAPRLLRHGRVGQQLSQAAR